MGLPQISRVTWKAWKFYYVQYHYGISRSNIQFPAPAAARMVNDIPLFIKYAVGDLYE